MEAAINTLLNVMTKNNYVVFDADDKLFNLNLIGIRSKDHSANTFNDTLFCIFKYKGNWIGYHYNVTVDPGRVYRINPAASNGAAIIVPGQYRGLWALGMHKGKYPALVQKNPVTVYRDNDKDVDIDTNVAKETGLFGINCHKAGEGITTNVDYYSAGCVVFENSELFDQEFLSLCRLAASSFGNSFTFTLLTEEMITA